MEIYVDLRCLQDPNYSFRGVGYHSSTLLRAGRQYFPQNCKWIGLVDSALPELPQEYVDLVDEMNQSPAPHVTGDAKLFLQLSPMTHDASRIQRFLSRPNVLSASIVYDFIPLDVPERYLTNNQVKLDFVSNLAWLNHYDHFFPISNYSADRLLDVADVSRAEVDVTGVALRPQFETILQGKPGSVPQAGKSAPEFFLFVGGGDARKNLDLVLESHAKLDPDGKPDLVVVGGYPPQLQDAAMQTYRAHGGNARQLLMKSGVTDDELATLYRDCVCSVCSSKIEGFSLPPVEALACGSAVLLSRNDAHQELISEPELTFEPDDSERLRQLMQRAVVDRPWLASAAERHRSVAERFTMDRVAYRFWAPITRSLQQIHGSSNRVPRITQRERIAILTPFPPDRSGVADYTRRAVEEIGKLADVDIYCENENPQPTEGVNRFYPFSDLPYRTGEYDNVVSVIGNSHFHTKAIEAQVQFGGPCLIHDNRLAELYNWWRGPVEFQKMASRSVGRNVSFEEAQDWVQNPGKLPSMFYDELIPSAQPLMLHSKRTVKHVKEQYGIDAEYLPFCIYREFGEELLTVQAKQLARQRLGIADDEVAIITLGFVSTLKAPLECMQAVASVRAAGTNAHLYFVGSATGQEDFVQSHAKALGVEDAIHLCGDWVDEQKYTDFVVAADLAVQLRAHFFGGLSGAMLDCIGSGLVTIANQDLAEALDSPRTVLQISDELLADDLANQILVALETFDLNDRLTPERSAYLKAHSFEVYARRFLEAVGLAETKQRYPASAA